MFRSIRFNSRGEQSSTDLPLLVPEVSATAAGPGREVRSDLVYLLWSRTQRDCCSTLDGWRGCRNSSRRTQLNELPFWSMENVSADMMGPLLQPHAVGLGGAEITSNHSSPEKYDAQEGI